MLANSGVIFYHGLRVLEALVRHQGRGNMSDWSQLQTTTDVSLTYSSSDAPIFVASTSSDLTGVVSVGMRLRLSQATGGIKYFIVVAITSSTISLYGGTDYSLVNEAISSPNFSSAKVPFGFSASPAKWTVEVTSTSDQAQSSPTNGTFYNAISIDIPIGAWDVTYYATLYLNKTTAAILDGLVTLSTSNNSESDVEFTTRCALDSNIGGVFRTFARKIVLLSSKTTHYLNMASRQSSINTIAILGTTNQKTIIRAVCAYL